MSYQKLLQQMIGVMLVMLLLVGCGAPAATPTPVPPTITPVPPTLTPSSGVLRGKLIGAESRKPLAGAAVILCLVTAEEKCRLKANLVTTVNEKGDFELAKVPPASYVVFYDPSGEAKAGWQDIDGLEMILKAGGFAPGFADSKEVFSTFGGGGAISWSKGAGVSWDSQGKASAKGSFTSVKYGLTIDFPDGKPVTVEIQLGKITELEIKAWAK